MKVRLKYVCKSKGQYGLNVSSDEYQPDGVRFIRTTDITEDGELRQGDEKYVSRDLSRGYFLNAGDILFSRSGTVGRAYLHDVSLRAQYAFAAYLVRFSPRPGVMPRYVFYVSRSSVFQDQVSAGSVQSTISNFNAEKYGDIEIQLPSYDEQRAIADFLDRKTAAIDALIEKKQRLIALLAEKRAALIHQAVTKGLDPDVPMKDSGVPWIGEIPAHWTVVKLVSAFPVIDCKHRTPTYRDQGYAVVSTTEVSPGVLDLSIVTRFIDEPDFLDMTGGGRAPQQGDVIYSRNASLGTAAYIDSGEPFSMGQDVVLLKAANGDGRFLCYQLNSSSCRVQVEMECIGSTFKRINVSKIRDLKICCPPYDEMKQISASLDHRVSDIDLTVSSVKKQLKTLKEYRQALITAAVTGQLDIPTS